MKAIDLLVGFGSVKDSYVISAEEFRQGKQKAQIKRLPGQKVWLIAAVIALMLLLVGCAVVYVLRMQNLKVGEYSFYIPTEYEKKELSRVLNQFLSSLPETERNVFLCRYWYLDSIQTISEVSGFSQSKVTSMLHRLRGKLRKKLSEEGYV